MCTQLSCVWQAGEAPTRALLATAAGALRGLDATAAATHADAAFSFLLRALDVRQRRPPSLARAGRVAGGGPGVGLGSGSETLDAGPQAPGPGAIAAVEAAAVGALVELVMKLSEARFRPLFQRLLAWAAAPPASDPGALIHRIACLAFFWH